MRCATGTSGWRRRRLWPRGTSCRRRDQRPRSAMPPKSASPLDQPADERPAGRRPERGDDDGGGPACGQQQPARQPARRRHQEQGQGGRQQPRDGGQPQGERAGQAIRSRPPEPEGPSQRPPRLEDRVGQREREGGVAVPGGRLRGRMRGRPGAPGPDARARRAAARANARVASPGQSTPGGMRPGTTRLVTRSRSSGSPPAVHSISRRPPQLRARPRRGNWGRPFSRMMIPAAASPAAARGSQPGAKTSA